MGGDAKELTGPDLAQGVAYAELAEGKPLLGHAGGEAVVVVRVGADVHAIGASCTHYGGPLAEGLVVGHTIRCPWHHACFDLKTGVALGAPALADNACYEVARQGELVQVRAKKEAPKPPAPKVAPSSVVILGAGAAGAACVETLRKQGYAGSITMLGAEEPGPVDRPNLSKDYLAGTAPEEWIPLGSREHWSKELGVELFPDTPAASLDVKAKKLTLTDGRTLSYDALLVATGAEPSRLPIEGAKLPHVFTLRTLADSRAIIERAKTAKRAVVIGTSFIGLEVAASLIARRLDVHVVGPDPVPLARVLGDVLGAHVKSLHEKKGVHFHLGVKPSSIREHEVELENGEKLQADLVVMGVGVKPRVSLAESAGLRVDNGVVVDDRLRASAASAASDTGGASVPGDATVAGVWAAGDIARYPDPRVGERVRVEHWVAAERQGQHAARAMLGSPAPFNDVPFFWSAHYDVQVSYVGHAPQVDAVEIHGSLESNDATVVYRWKGKPLAVATLNRDTVALKVEAAMEKGDWDAVEAALKD